MHRYGLLTFLLSLVLFLPACSATANKNIAGITSPDVVVNVISPQKLDLKSGGPGLEHLLAIKPADGDISSKYGPRKLSRRSATRQHNGIDISAPKGSPVLASGAGTVTYAGRKSTFGNFVEILHEDGISTRYAHLSKISVKKGQEVAAGDQLGTVGSTGRSTGPHLHFEVVVNEKRINPLSAVDWS